MPSLNMGKRGTFHSKAVKAQGPSVRAVESVGFAGSMWLPLLQVPSRGIMSLLKIRGVPHFVLQGLRWSLMNRGQDQSADCWSTEAAEAGIALPERAAGCQHGHPSPASAQQ